MELRLYTGGRGMNTIKGDGVGEEWMTLYKEDRHIIYEGYILLSGADKLKTRGCETLEIEVNNDSTFYDLTIP